MGYDILIGALIGLAKTTDGNEHLISRSSTALIIECLQACNAPDRDVLVADLLNKVDAQKREMAPNCYLCAAPCGKNDPYDMRKLDSDAPEIHDMKNSLLSGIIKMAVNDRADISRAHLYYKTLILIGMDNPNVMMLQSVLSEVMAHC